MLAVKHLAAQNRRRQEETGRRVFYGAALPSPSNPPDNEAVGFRADALLFGDGWFRIGLLRRKGTVRFDGC